VSIEQEAMNDVIETCVEVVELRKKLAEAMLKRDVQVANLHSFHGMPKTRIAERLEVRACLLGYSDDEIAEFGISSWSVRNILDNAQKDPQNA